MAARRRGTLSSRLTLKKTRGEPACERVGFRVFDDIDLEKAAAHFERAGVPARFVEVPVQGRTLHVDDAAGIPLELVARMPSHVRTQTKTHTHKGACALRMDHYQVLVPDVAAAARFYLELGFRTSDYVCVAGSDKLVGIFLHRKDNPTTWCFCSAPARASITSVTSFRKCDHTVRALDIAGNLGLGECLEHGPGRHGHGHSYYVYLRDPDGHRIELLLPATQIIDIDDEPMMPR